MDYMTIQILSFLFLPLLSFVLLIFGGKYFKDKSHYVGLSLIGLMLLSAFMMILNAEPYTKDGSYVKWVLYNSFEWFSTGSFSVSLGYFVDNVTAIMLLVVAFIGFLVHLYSSEYMKGDKRYSRYFAFLGIFIFSMNGIILADSLKSLLPFFHL